LPREVGDRSVYAVKAVTSLGWIPDHDREDLKQVVMMKNVCAWRRSAGARRA
jgi:hypothetical protein